MNNIPSFWLWCAIVGVLVTLVATAYIVVTEYPPVASLLKKAEIRFLVWRANHSRLSDGQKKKVRDLIEEGEIAVVDIQKKFPPPGEPWFYIPSRSSH